MFNMLCDFDGMKKELQERVDLLKRQRPPEPNDTRRNWSTLRDNEVSFLTDLLKKYEDKDLW